MSGGDFIIYFLFFENLEGGKSNPRKVSKIMHPSSIFFIKAHLVMKFKQQKLLIKCNIYFYTFFHPHICSQKT